MLKDARAVYTPGLSERAGSTSSFYHGDALGSTRGITSASQAVTDAILYDAFGMTVSRTGSTPTPFGFVGAQGYQSDADSGLMLLGNRYYDASIGRFISSDPAKAGSNWFAYCENNALRRIDPLGLKLVWWNPLTWFEGWGRAKPSSGSTGDVSGAVQRQIGEARQQSIDLARQREAIKINDPWLPRPPKVDPPEWEPSGTYGIWVPKSPLPPESGGGVEGGGGVEVGAGGLEGGGMAAVGGFLPPEEGGGGGGYPPDEPTPL